MNNITFIKNGDIFNSKCETFVCPVNCVGVMGKGLALEFKNRFPYMYGEYKYLCLVKHIQLGDVYIIRISPNREILLFPTKYHYNDLSKIKDIEMGLKKLVRGAQCIDSLAVPALGCGLGGLEWEQVKPIVIEYLSQLDIPVEIYEPLEEMK